MYTPLRSQQPNVTRQNTTYQNANVEKKTVDTNRANLISFKIVWLSYSTRGGASGSNLAIHFWRVFVV